MTSLRHFTILLLAIYCILCKITSSAPAGGDNNNEGIIDPDFLEEDSQKSNNSFIDDIIEMFRDSWAEQMDPLKVPKSRFSFQKSFIGIKLYGSVLLADSKLNGLSRLHRTKDSFIGPDSESGLMFADVTVGVQCLNLTGFAEISLMGLRITSPLFFEMANTEINVKSYLDPKPGNNKPIIDDLTVTELEGVTLDLPAIGFAGSTLIDMGIKLLLTTFRGSLKEALRMNLLRFVDKAVHKSHLRLN